MNGNPDSPEVSVERSLWTLYSNHCSARAAQNI